MPIQFHCPGCSQPIEVDDEFADREAQCPYCRRVVTVPAESALDQAYVATARPAEGDAPGADDAQRGLHQPHPRATTPALQPIAPTPAEAYGPDGEGLHVGPSPYHKERVANRYGVRALVCTVIAYLLFLAFGFQLMGLLLEELDMIGTVDPTQEQINEASLAAAQKVYETNTGRLLMVGVSLLAVIGLCLAIVSVSQRTKNWKGILALVLCALAMLCGCPNLLGILSAPG